MPRINVLPKHIADLIAAGEVVERPASVIKEVMENAIDAGADSITVEIRHGGITYMRVTDNGCGIEREDIRNAFRSHATSKILTEDDLRSIGTLGFRGEALASIAAVSKVDVLTRTEDAEIGTVYKIEGSQEVLLDDAGCPLGTTIVIRDLFYNTPARMKFLKKDITEGNAVAGVVDRIALSHPEVSVRFIRDDRQQLATSGNGKLSSAVYSVFGKDFSGGLLETEYELNGVKVDGLVSKPTASRANRSMQFFFLNGRLVKSKTMCAALEQAYKGAIMVGRFPSCVLNVHIPLDTVDVNVHPAKTEVRFSDEKRIFDAVYYAAKNAIDKKDVPNRLELTKQELKRQSPYRKETGEQLRFGQTKSGTAEKKSDLPEKIEGFWSKELPKEWEREQHRSKGKKKPEGKPVEPVSRPESKPDPEEIPREKAEEPVPIPQDPPVPRKNTPSLDIPFDDGPKEEKRPEPPKVFRPAEKPVTEEREAEAPEKKTADTRSDLPKPEEKKAARPPKPYLPKQEEVTAAVVEEGKNKVEVHVPIRTDPVKEEEPVPYAEQVEVPPFRLIGEAFETYIIFESEGKITLVDKHAAHERILYEDLLAGRETVKSQLLLAPLTVTLSKEEYSVLLENQDLLQQAGYAIDDFGTGTIVVREVPVMLMQYDITALIEEMAGHLLEKQSPAPEKLKWIYANTACRAAIKAGDHTPPEEQKKLIEYLLTHREIRYCPHGRPICIEMTRTELERGFGRIQK